MREHPKTGPYVDGCTLVRVYSIDQIKALIELGNRNRCVRVCFCCGAYPAQYSDSLPDTDIHTPHPCNPSSAVAATSLNAYSSRSHAVFAIHYIKSRRDMENGALMHQTSKLNLIDLAGSENSSAAGTTGERLKEGGSINKSLLTLGLVIKQLSQNAQKKGPKVRQAGRRQLRCVWWIALQLIPTRRPPTNPHTAGRHPVSRLGADLPPEGYVPVTDHTHACISAPPRNLTATERARYSPP